MSEFDYFLERNAAQKIDERVAQTQRSRVPAQRKRPNRHFLRRHR